jgi:Mn2+/Fe2+ NRAMP family transporter
MMDQIQHERSFIDVNTPAPSLMGRILSNGFIQRMALFLTVFGPATITAMADNDANGVATYSVAGAKLGYPILFVLSITTILLAITQEMGMRLTVVTRRGLADLIREKYGVKVSLFIFAALIIANMGTIIGNMAAIRAVSSRLHIPSIPSVFFIVVIVFLFVTYGNYRLTQGIMFIACLFYMTYIFAAIKANPDWSLALSNLVYPHGVEFTSDYLKSYLVIGLGVLGTTITPWGQFFVSSFSFDKKIEVSKLRFSQFETYLGAFLTDFFSFFMIVATAATLYYAKIPLESGEQAALAIKPFAGELAGTLFALGILNAGFMGIVIVSLSTAYAFSEFFGISGGLNTSLKQSRSFYIIFLIQLIIAVSFAMIPNINVFTLAIATQGLNATILPLVLIFLIRLTSNKKLMKEHVNSSFQKWFSIIATCVIVIAATGAMFILFVNI